MLEWNTPLHIFRKTFFTANANFFISTMRFSRMSAVSFTKLCISDLMSQISNAAYVKAKPSNTSCAINVHAWAFTQIYSHENAYHSSFQTKSETPAVFTTLIRNCWVCCVILFVNLQLLIVGDDTASTCVQNITYTLCIRGMTLQFLPQTRSSNTMGAEGVALLDRILNPKIFPCASWH